ncbi:MAG: tetratricopeptide repeat protein [Burkholderiales bacterium]
MSAFSARKLEQAGQRLQRGDIAGAQLLCQQVLQRAPRNPEALFLLGMSHLVAGQPREAVTLLENALAVAPLHGAALENLGLAQLLLGRFGEAEHVLRKAATLPGAPASVHMRLGLAMLRQRQYAEAIAVLEHALRLAPHDADCHLNLGQAFAGADNSAAARAHFEAALRLAPRHVDAMFDLGVLALQQDELDEARRWFEQTLAQSPRHAEALVNLGIVLQKQSQLDAAAACLQRALEIDPALAVAHGNLAHTLALQGKLTEARQRYLATLALAPELPEAHEGLASVCLKLGRLKEGILHLREALKHDTGNCGAWTALADALFQDGQLDEAAAAAQRASDIDPAAAGPYSVLALVHIVRKEADRAIAVLETGFQRTGASSLLGMLTHQLQRTCDWEKWRAAWHEMQRRLEHSTDLGSPFWLLTEATTAEQQLSYTRRWAHAHYPPTAHAPRTPPRAAQRRIRIGYLSSDFHEHATAHLLAGVLERHDRSRFEIFAYSYGPEDHSAMRARLRQACEHFIDVAWDPDDIVVDRIRGDAPDILVDLKGYTLGARTAILARRPCAIQINWLGYPGTMGADFIDYLITDGFIVPPDSESAYSEKILRLAHCWQCNDRSRPVIEPLARGQYGLPDDGFVFCCFNQTVKITPEVFAVWMNLLRRVPHSVLWLAEDNPWATKNLRDAAQSHGIAPQRLVFSLRLPLAQHLARYRVADLALDTFPYTSHTTASDALWLGCPLVALCGDTFAARVSGSILTACGLPELITHSLPEYEELAYRYAIDTTFAAAIRTKLAAVKTEAPLYDAAAFARDLERLYLSLLENDGTR